MKLLKLLALHLLSFAVVVALPLQSAVNVRNEPRHLIKFANKFVRVIDATVRVGDATLFHTHDIDNVPVNVSGGNLKTELLGQQGIFSTVATGAVSYARETYTHRITNVGNTDVRFIDAEILESPTNGAAAPPPIENVKGYTLVIDNERVRIYRLILEPGESTGLFAHKLPWLSVAVSKGRIAIEDEKRKSKNTDFQAGGFRWHLEPATQNITNIGASRFEMVDIEWK
jgi:hypothetical protein